MPCDRRHELCSRGRRLTGTVTKSNLGLRAPARVPAVIWIPNLSVFALIAAGALCAFPGTWTHYLDSVFAAEPAQIPLSLMFLELSGYYVTAVQLHVNAASALVRRGVDGEGSR